MLKFHSQNILSCVITGLWAVVNTAGSCCRGRLDAQEASQWEALLRVNVVGALKTARAFLPLLRHAKGQ